MPKAWGLFFIRGGCFAVNFIYVTTPSPEHIFREACSIVGFEGTAFAILVRLAINCSGSKAIEGLAPYFDACYLSWAYSSKIVKFKAKFMGIIE